MKNKSSNRESRRKLLKKLATSSAAAGVVAIPGSWAQPTIKSLVLPAHAVLQRSPPPDRPPQPLCRIRLILILISV